MKHFIFFTLLLHTVFSFAQPIDKFAYRVVVKNSNVEPLKNEVVSLKIKIFDEQNLSSKPLFEETFDKQNTGPLSIVNLEIGTKGTVNLNSLPWGQQQLYLGVSLKIDPTDYKETTDRPSEIISVPSAIYSHSADVANRLHKSEIPSGTVVSFVGEKAPEGWVLCDGGSYHKNDPKYNGLYNVIRESFGSPNSSEFNVPDLRGRFVRGWSSSDDSNNDPDKDIRVASQPGGAKGNQIGSLQTDATSIEGVKASTDLRGDHSHLVAKQTEMGRTQLNGSLSGSNMTIATAKNNMNKGSIPNNLDYSSYGLNGVINQEADTGVTNTKGGHDHTVTLNGAKETRPVNVYLNYIIKL